MISLMSQRRGGASKEPPMAPLIDMIFILLIFFLVTTSFVKESGVDVKRPMPSKTPEDTTKKTSVILNITKEGQIFIDDRAIDIRSIRGFMERFIYEMPGGSVVITADPQTKTGLVITALDQCKQAGIQNVSVTTSEL